MSEIFIILKEYLVNLETNKANWTERIDEFEKGLSYNTLHIIFLKESLNESKEKECK